MPLSISKEKFGGAWVTLLRELLYHPEHRPAPRDKPIHEILNVQLTVENALNNILLSDVRKPNYRFMIGEFLWIYFGHDDVASIARYNSKIAAFSDDGKTLRGAYGPRVGASFVPREAIQLRTRWNLTIEKLRQDPDTRQAVIVVFAPFELVGETKDVPCTLSQQFFLREPGRFGGTKRVLHSTVNMRSSDVWLGLVYDLFVFSMMQNVMAAELDAQVGSITFNLGSSHLYEEHYDIAKTLLEEHDADVLPVDTLSSPEFTERPPAWLDEVFTSGHIADNLSLARWAVAAKQPWTSYALALMERKSIDALDRLVRLAGTDNRVTRTAQVETDPGPAGSDPFDFPKDAGGGYRPCPLCGKAYGCCDHTLEERGDGVSKKR